MSPASWISPDMLLTRMNFAADLVGNRLAGSRVPPEALKRSRSLRATDRAGLALAGDARGPGRSRRQSSDRVALGGAGISKEISMNSSRRSFLQIHRFGLSRLRLAAGVSRARRRRTQQVGEKQIAGRGVSARRHGRLECRHPVQRSGLLSTCARASPSREPAAGEERAIDLDGFYGLHPALAPLKSIYDKGHLAFVHAAGSPDNTRSHFDAQDYMEIGTPGIKSTPDGWLNRYLDVKAEQVAVAISRRRLHRATAAHARRRRTGADAVVD